jgi:hypothetical protein
VCIWYAIYTSLLLPTHLHFYSLYGTVRGTNFILISEEQAFILRNLDQRSLGVVEVMDLVRQGFLSILFSIVCGCLLGTHDVSFMISILIDFIGYA